MQPSRDISVLLDIMARLRDPETGCPWDVEQDFTSIAPHTLEEAYEVVDAIARNSLTDLRDELGDLLLQVVFHAQMARERNAFTFGDVVQAITDKLIRRHPHIFGNASAASPEEVLDQWNRIKQQEKSARGHTDAPSLLDQVPAGLPALLRSEKLQDMASGVGFDWPEATQVIAKLREELDELEQAIANKDHPNQREEIGDLLFALVNLARHLKVDPEPALAATNAKFMRRFAYIEQRLRDKGTSLSHSCLDEMEQLYHEGKAKGL